MGAAPKSGRLRLSDVVRWGRDEGYKAWAYYAFDASGGNRGTNYTITVKFYEGTRAESEWSTHQFTGYIPQPGYGNGGDSSFLGGIGWSMESTVFTLDRSPYDGTGCH